MIKWKTEKITSEFFKFSLGFTSCIAKLPIPAASFALALNLEFDLQFNNSITFLWELLNFTTFPSLALYDKHPFKVSDPCTYNIY